MAEDQASTRLAKLSLVPGLALGSSHVRTVGLLLRP